MDFVETTLFQELQLCKTLTEQLETDQTMPEHDCGCQVHSHCKFVTIDGQEVMGGALIHGICEEHSLEMDAFINGLSAEKPFGDGVLLSGLIETEGDGE